MSMEMSIIYRFIDSEQHANIDENVDFPANVDGNVENISIFLFKTTCKCVWKWKCDGTCKYEWTCQKYIDLSFPLGTTRRISQDWLQQMVILIEKNCKCISMLIVPNFDPICSTSLHTLSSASKVSCPTFPSLLNKRDLHTTPSFLLFSKISQATDPLC